MTSFWFLICVAPCYLFSDYFFISDLHNIVSSFRWLLSLIRNTMHLFGDYFFISDLHSTEHLSSLLTHIQFAWYCASTRWLLSEKWFCISLCIFADYFLISELCSIVYLFGDFLDLIRIVSCPFPLTGILPRGENNMSAFFNNKINPQSLPFGCAYVKTLAPMQ